MLCSKHHQNETQMVSLSLFSVKNLMLHSMHHQHENCPGHISLAAIIRLNQRSRKKRLHNHSLQFVHNMNNSSYPPTHHSFFACPNREDLSSLVHNSKFMTVIIIASNHHHSVRHKQQTIYEISNHRSTHR